MAGGVDWVEAGTPLIKAEGLNAVRELKAAFPDKLIFADMKTMDAGRIEVEYAAKAGAGLVGVLGAASDSTIKECIEAAHNYGCKLIVDMIEVADPVARARQAEELGRRLRRHPHGDRPADARRGAVRDAAAPWPRPCRSPCQRGRRHQLARRRRRPWRPAPASSWSAAPSPRPTDATAAAAEIRRAVDEGVCIETTLYKRAGEADIRARARAGLDGQHLRRLAPPAQPARHQAAAARLAHVRPGRDRAHLPRRLGQAGRGDRRVPARRRAGDRRLQQLPRHLGRARHAQRQGQGPGRPRGVGRHPRHARDRAHRLSGLLQPRQRQRRRAQGLRRDQRAGARSPARRSSPATGSWATTTA